MQLPFHSNENTHEGFRTGFDTGQSPERWQLIILWPSTGDTTSILTQSRRSRKCRAYNKHAKLFTGLPWPESCRSFVPRTSRRMQESHAESRKHLRTSVTVQLKTGFWGLWNRSRCSLSTSCWLGGSGPIPGTHRAGAPPSPHSHTCGQAALDKLTHWECMEFTPSFPGNFKFHPG